MARITKLKKSSSKSTHKGQKVHKISQKHVPISISLTPCTYSTNPFKKSDQIIVLLERFFKINKNSYLNNSSQSEYELII